jgi:16S rRNA (cytidine1402-2'-O)-methyltransferase
VARELTKKFEEFARGTVAELAARFGDEPARGEIVILVGGGEEKTLDEEALREIARDLQSAGTSSRDIQDRLVMQHGAPRNLAYNLAHEE